MELTKHGKRFYFLTGVAYGCVMTMLMAFVLCHLWVSSMNASIDNMAASMEAVGISVIASNGDALPEIKGLRIGEVR